MYIILQVMHCSTTPLYTTQRAQQPHTAHICHDQMQNYIQCNGDDSFRRHVCVCVCVRVCVNSSRTNYASETLGRGACVQQIATRSEHSST